MTTAGSYTGPTQVAAGSDSTNPFGTSDYRFTAYHSGVPIYTGPHLATNPGPWATGEIPFGSTQTTTPAGDIESTLYPMDANQLRSFQTSLYKGGYLNKGDISGIVDDATRSQFGALLQDTYLYNQQGIDITWQQVLARRQAVMKSQGLAGSGGQRSTETHTDVSYLDPLAAQRMANDTFSNNLGRNPSLQERAAFTAGLRAYEQAHPTVSTTTGLGTGNVRTTTRQGANPADYADAYTHSTQNLANEQGSQQEIGFVNVLKRIMGG